MGGCGLVQVIVTLRIPLRIRFRHALPLRLWFILGWGEQEFGSVVVVDAGVAVLQFGWGLPLDIAVGLDGGAVPAVGVDSRLSGPHGQGHLTDRLQMCPLMPMARIGTGFVLARAGRELPAQLRCTPDRSFDSPDSPSRYVDVGQTVEAGAM